MKDAKARHDAQTTDAADADQEQATPAMEDTQEEPEDGEEDLEDMKPDDKDQEQVSVFFTYIVDKRQNTCSYGY